MKSADNFFTRIAKEIYSPPFAETIPLNYDALNRKSPISILWRKIRPAASLWWHRQSALQRPFIEAAHMRILWIYKGSPQVGDALMDLGSRMLLQDSGIKLDLYTDRHLHQLFDADDIFSRVFSDPEQIDARDYDLAILDSFKWRCLEAKIKYAPQVPFVTMRGYFSGPEFNRTLFSFFRMQQLLRMKAPAATTHAVAAPCLASSNADKELIGQIGIPDNAVAFAIGGASEGRTYLHWDKVIQALLERHRMPHIVLLGSANGVSMREKIIAAVRPYGVPLIDGVDQYSLTQTFEIIKKCRLAVCADGGLLHIANAAHIPTVSLFDRDVSPDMRLTAANRTIALQSKGTISDLPVAEVVGAVEQALSAYV